jgi:alpha-L-fucosidase
MSVSELSRRSLLKLLGAAGAGAAAVGGAADSSVAAQSASQAAAAPKESPALAADRERRMKWWHDARFGMFIHWGAYSAWGRHEWAMENEAIPVTEYAQFAKRFTPKPNAARAWAQLGKRAGQKYMVMTTKHHEGFCLFDTQTTTYCAPKQGPGRDLVREYVEAARAEGLRVGFYYSLMDWHHPDGARSATDEAARRRFVDYIHTHVRELMSNYGKIDILWYDVASPLDAKGWESDRMNEMVFKLQPDIIVNNRNKLDGDFSTPEQQITAAAGGRAWESCMTMNASWGYQAADDDWKSPKTIVRNLISCARDGGNYLLNIGPRGDGSIPEESVRILDAVGSWLDRNGSAIYMSDRCQPRRSAYATFTRKGNTLFMHVHFWPGDTASIAGLQVGVKSARLLATGQTVKFQQDPLRLQLTGLPAKAPDQPMTTIAIECDGEPRQDTNMVRDTHQRPAV